MCEVAENLIVGPVFANDVEDVLDRRTRADRPRNRRADWSVRRIEPDGVGVRRERVDLARVLGERRTVGRRHRADRAEEAIDNSVVGRIGGRRHPSPAEDEHLLAVAAEDRAGRIRAGGHEAVHEAVPGVAHVDEGDCVVVGVGDDERQTVWRQGQRIRRRGWRRPREQIHRDLLDRLSRKRVIDPHRRTAAARDEQSPAVGRQKHRVRMLVRRQLVDERQRRRGKHLDARPAPKRHVQRLAVRRHHAGVRLGGKRYGFHNLTAGQIDRRQRHREHAGDVEHLAVAAHREPACESVAGLLGQIERARACQSSVSIGEFLNVVLAGAGGVQLRSVGMPRQAVPRTLELCGVLDRPARHVDHAERRLCETVVGNDQIAAVGRLDYVERQIANRQMAAGRRQPPSVGQQR